MTTISSNTLIRNEINYLDGLIQNLLDAGMDELLFLDGGSTDGTYEKLMQYSKENSKIVVLRWPQPENSEYRTGFKEKERRNLMMQASTSEYILYIDADERIDPLFDKSILDTKADIYIVWRYHFWENKIRVKMQGDLTWTPEVQMRIVRNHGKLIYKSKDVFGLHNFLSSHGVKVYNQFHDEALKRNLAKGINLCNRVRIENSNTHIYHLHYLNVVKGSKKNDLRSYDFDREILMLDDMADGLKHDFSTENVICCISGAEKHLDRIGKYI